MAVCTTLLASHSSQQVMHRCDTGIRRAGPAQGTGCNADESHQPKADPDDELDWETIGPDGTALPAEARPDIGPTESSGTSRFVRQFTGCWCRQLFRPLLSIPDRHDAVNMQACATWAPAKA